MINLLPRQEFEAKIRNTTTGISLYVRKIKKAFEELEDMSSLYTTNKRYIILHHSWTEDSTTVSWNPIRENHMRRWNIDEIGYQFGIEEVRKEGVYEILYGRRINSKGYHCPQGKMNSLGLGFMFCGNFDIAPPPISMLYKAADFIADICIMTGIPTCNIHGHRDFNLVKTCPGKYFNINEFKQLVEERI